VEVREPRVAFNLEMVESSFTIGLALPDGLSIGGVPAWATELCRCLNARNQPAVMLEHPAPFKPTFARPESAQVRVTACGQIKPFRTSRLNARSYESVLPGVLIPNYSDGTYATCARLSRQHAERMRVIGFCHTFEDYYFSTLNYYEPIIHRFVAVSEECASALKTQLPHRAADVVMRPYGIQVPSPLQRHYSVRGTPLRLLYAGRLDELQKRVFRLPELASELARHDVDFRLRIVGNGLDKRRLQARIRQLPTGVSNRISVEEAISPKAMAGLYEATDVCILVSDYEGTSLFMLEGMAHGCVPVVTKVSGTANVIEPSHNGYYASRDDLGALVHCIKTLDDDRCLLATMGQNAHRSAARYSWDTYVPWFLDLASQVWKNEVPRAWPASRRIYKLPSFLGVPLCVADVVGINYFSNWLFHKGLTPQWIQAMVRYARLAGGRPQTGSRRPTNRNSPAFRRKPG